MDKLGIAANIGIAPYAQLMQETLNPDSTFSKNSGGFNVALFRLEDWIRDRQCESPEVNARHVATIGGELVAAVAGLRARNSTTILVFIAPPSPALGAEYIEKFAGIERDLQAQFAGITGVYCYTHRDVEHLYQVSDYDDATGDRLGHIPYTPRYFLAVTTLLARRIAAFVKPRSKVIAVDCDNTLWKGLCGEDDVEITAAHREFQDTLVQQYDAGTLLCLCSKNNPEDVAAVFGQTERMVLRKKHFIAERVNWVAKSTNLQSLAQELDLSLDSFIFVDDSLLECAEVRQFCPSVLTLEFPQSSAAIEQFARHTWAFDRIEATAEAKRRTAQYKENQARLKASKSAGNLSEFIASLELQVEMAVMETSQLARVAELIQRTNQFNLSGTRRRSAELEMLFASQELSCLVVRVKDRFGDYGLVGAALLRRESDAIDIDTFVLSCRVLGRGVEHRIVNELGRVARREGLSKVVLRFRQTSRNAPAGSFIAAHFATFEASADAGLADSERVFVVPTSVAETISPVPSLGALADEGNESVESDRGQGSRGEIEPASSSAWHEPACRLASLDDISEEMNRWRQRRSSDDATYIAPSSAMESIVASVWSEILHLDRVSVRANFFDLGGDSVMAVQVISRIDSIANVTVSIAQFFEKPTVEMLARRLAQGSRSESPIRRQHSGDTAPTSKGQERIWFIDQVERGGVAYHVPLGLLLHGDLDLVALKKSLDDLVARHEVLRTVFLRAGAETVQHIVELAKFDLLQLDLTQLSTERRADELAKQQMLELTTPFDLSNGPLIRGRMLLLSPDEHVLLITVSHIVFDGWSSGILLRELAKLYDAHRASNGQPLPPLPIQYADYAVWQREWLQGAEVQEQLAYWKSHLFGAPELLELPADRRRPGVRSYRGANVRVSLGLEITAQLKALSRRLDLTLAMTMYTAWSIVMSRLSGSDDVIVGMPVANRRRTEVEGLIGFFVNTLVVRVRLELDPIVTDLLRRVREVMIDAYANQDVPFDRVVETLQPARGLSHSPIFQVMFAMQNVPRSEIELPGLQLVELEIPQITAPFDLSLLLQDSEDGVSGSLNYATDLFDAATINRWVGYFVAVLRQMAVDTDVPVSWLELMDEEERGSVVRSFNATHADYEQEKMLHQKFEEQARHVPHAVAVTCGEQQFTYEQLNNRANQLAHLLIARGVKPDERVGIYIDRSVEMVVGLLGVLKAGGAYVPLDVSYPIDRLEHMLRDSAPVIVLTQKRRRSMKLLATTEIPVLTIDSDVADIENMPRSNLSAAQTGVAIGNAAYVIYTSGSTGVPKGVVIEHRNVTNVIDWTEATFGVTAGQLCSSVAAVAFDAATWEIWLPLSVGSTLVVAPMTASEDIEAFLTWWQAQPLDIGFLPSPIADLVFARGIRHTTLATLLVGGDRLSHRATGRSFQLVNNYGPTESTIVATSGHIVDDGGVLHIGRPIANTQVYILNRWDQPVPIGVVGEINIGGSGVARGYLNLPELSAARFAVDRFSSEPHARMYRSGDLGRWRADGTIEFIGRNDHQIKIRGFRVELGEIEAQLALHPQVVEAAVTARDDAPGRKRLVAYVTTCDGRETSGEELRAHLKASLPDYMVPSTFVTLAHMPLTANGKLDRRALPAPSDHAGGSKQYEPPCGDLETSIASIWETLLQTGRVGRDDNFFDVGGHSMLAMQAAVHIRASLALEMPVRWLFEFPSVRQLAARLEPLRYTRLLDSVRDGGESIDELLDEVASMAENEVHDLMGKSFMERG